MTPALLAPPRKSGRRRALHPAWPLLALDAVLLAIQVSSAAWGKSIAILLAFTAAFRWRLDRVVVAIMVIFLVVDDPATNPFNDLWDSPLKDVGGFWFDTIGTSIGVPIPMAPMVLIPMVALWRAATNRTGPRMTNEGDLLPLPGPFKTALTAGAAVIPLAMAYGYFNGGDVQQMYYQSFGSILALSLAGVFAKVTTPRLVTILTRVIVLAAVYRALLAIYIYLTIAREVEGGLPLYLTSHSDTILWSAAVILVIVRVLESPTTANRLLALGLGPILGAAIVVNNRRTAWIVIAAAGLYLVLSASRGAKRRLAFMVAFAVPGVALYVAAGLAAPPQLVFSPVQSLESVVTGTDSSSESRDIENFNLIVTGRSSFPIPTGFGAEYIEAVPADDISRDFPQYRYLPHNSVMAMLVYLGPIGLALILSPLIVGMQASHQLRRESNSPDSRTMAAVCITLWIGFVAQSWGDLGLFTALPAASAGLAAGLGVGLRAWYTQRHRASVSS